MRVLELLTELFHLERESQKKEEHNWIQRGSLQDVGRETKSSLRLDC